MQKKGRDELETDFKDLRYGKVCGAGGQEEEAEYFLSRKRTA